MTEITPTSVRDAADAINQMATERTTLEFRGTGSQRGRTQDAVMTSLAMNQIVDWLVEDLTVVAEAGVTVGELESLVNTQNQTTLLPMDDPTRTVGGVIAQGASSFARLKYGPTRDRVLEVTLATGYGKVVRGGGRLVKNVTGYDLPRLATGSLGSLGFIGSVCLKLWPITEVRQVVAVDEPATAYRDLFRPVAVLETEAGGFVFLEGSASDVAAQTELCGGQVVDALPPGIEAPYVLSIRVPPRHLSDFVDAIRGVASSFVAQHGIGVIDAGFTQLDVSTATALRIEAEAVGGVVILERGEIEAFDRWGAPPSTLEIQRRIKDLFDPRHVCNPGVLPGGV